MIGEPLTPLQFELLKIYSTKISKTELVEVKNILEQYFAHKAIAGADKIWDEQKLSNNDIDEWLGNE